MMPGTDNGPATPLMTRKVNIMKISVLIVDDHAVVRQGLRSILLDMADNFEVVGEAANGLQAILMAGDLHPNLILLDLIMPEMDGVTAIKKIKSISPNSRITVLTSSEDEKLAFDAIEAGAQSYLLKSMLGPELLVTLRRIAGGEDIIHPFVATRILKAVRHGSQPAPGPFDRLTERELDVLRALAEGGSNARIASMLHISEATVKSHISSLFSKLDLKDRTEAVALAWRQGLVKVDE